MKTQKKNVKDRLLERRIIDPNTGCWLWSGARLATGYGAIHIKGSVRTVHRTAYIEFVGPPLNQVNHKRECPNRHCFNPDHLYDGTQSENILDSFANGQNHYNAVKTHCPRGHEYNEENTRMNDGARICKKCRHEDYIFKKELYG